MHLYLQYSFLALWVVSWAVCEYGFVEAISVEALREGLKDMKKDEVASFKVTVEAVEYHGPFYYPACSELRGKRMCGCEVDEDDYCKRCNANVTPVNNLKLLRGKFRDLQSGETMRVTAFDKVAEELLGFDATDAVNLDEQCLRSGDQRRELRLGPYSL